MPIATGLYPNVIHVFVLQAKMAEVAKPPIVMKEKVSLGEAVEKVGLLQKLHITDQQPCIEALSLPVQYQVNFDTNFVDKNAFVTGVAKYIEEATVHANLVGTKSYILERSTPSANPFAVKFEKNKNFLH